MFRFYSDPSRPKIEKIRFPSGKVVTMSEFVKVPRVSVVGEHSEGVLKIAVARCSVKDEFVKSKGRAIAEKRLEDNKLFDSYVMDECTTDTFIEIAKEVAKEVIETYKITQMKLENGN